MKFNLKFERKLSKHFQLNLNKLNEDLATLVAKSSNFYNKNELFLNSYNHITENYLKHILIVINQSLQEQNNPCFLNNKLLIKVIDNNDHNEAYYDQLDHINNNCFSNFFENKDNLIAFNKLPQINIIQDQRTTSKIFKIVDAEKYINILHCIIELLYSQYSFNKQISSKVVRFTKKITDDLYIGLEYNRSVLEQDLDRGIKLPVFRIILFNNEFNRKIKEIEYLDNSRQDIIYITDLANPFFKNFPLEISSVFSKTILEENESGKTFNVEKILNKDYDLYFRKYMFYQLYMQKFHVTDFLNYIERSIIDSLTDDRSFGEFEYNIPELEHLKERTQFLINTILPSKAQLVEAFEKKLISQNAYNKQINFFNHFEDECNINLKILSENGIKSRN